MNERKAPDKAQSASTAVAEAPGVPEGAVLRGIWPDSGSGGRRRVALTDPVELQQLDLEALPAATVTAAWIPMLEDGMGQPIRVPILVAKGARSGPVLGLTAAVHGDELNGVAAIHQLLPSIDLRKLRGTIVAVVVANPLAYFRRTRRLEEAHDLNHMFPGRPDGHVGEVLAERMRDKLLRRMDVLLDLHTASKGRVNTLYVRADMTHPLTARMAYLQRPQIIVHNPPSDGTLRGMAASLGIPAITVEIGDPQLFQRKYARRALSGLRAVLADLRMIPRKPGSMGEEPIVCNSSAWMFTDQGGLMVMDVGLAEPVVKGQVVARQLDIFGRERGRYRAPKDGVVIGHAVDPVAPTGSRILHIGRVHSFSRPGILSREDVRDAARKEHPWEVLGPRWREDPACGGTTPESPPPREPPADP